MTEATIQAFLQLVNHSKIRDGKTEYIEEIREKAKALKPHFDEKYPAWLLDRSHPGEQEWMKIYRAHTWNSSTTAATGRVINSCQKIQQADDFKILWDSDPKNTGIIEENSLEKYCKEYFPKYETLENWAFTAYLKEIFKDANSVFLVLPDLEPFIERQDNNLDWSKPYPQLFDSDDIVYRKEESIIVKLDELEVDGKKWDRFLGVTMEGLVLAIQYQDYAKDVNAFKEFRIDYQFIDFPATKCGKKIDEIEDGMQVYDSFVQPCIASWNKACFRTADVEVTWPQHGSPQYWRIKSSECKTCKGTGFIFNAKRERTECTSCIGTGQGSDGSPFNQIEITLPKSTVTNPNPVAPNLPPAGYVERKAASEAIKDFNNDEDRQIYKGFQAIGLELLANVPTVQSGIAKQYDRKEINTFFYQVQDLIVYGITHTAKLIYNLRNAPIANATGLSIEKRTASLPKVTLAVDFDILSMEILTANLSQAKKDSYNPIIIAGMERDYTAKLYGEDSQELKFIEVSMKLDPLSDKSTDEKVILKDSYGCSEIDFITSVNITGFINQKLEEDPNWLQKKLPEQRKDLKVLASEKQGEIKAGLRPVITEVRAIA